MISKYFKGFIIIGLFSFSFSAAEKEGGESVDNYNSYYGLDGSFQTRNGTIGQFGFPSNPMNDRAKGYLLNGVVKNAITNYGNFITWDEHPAGLWGEYSYLPNVSMIAGVPGSKYSCGVCVDDDPNSSKLIEFDRLRNSLVTAESIELSQFNKSKGFSGKNVS